MAYSPPPSKLLALSAALLLLFFTGLINHSPHPNFLSSTPGHPNGVSAILKGATSLALRDCCRGPLRLDQHDPSLKPARPAHHIANSADPEPAVQWSSSSSIFSRNSENPFSELRRTSRINPKDQTTITTRGLISQVDHETALKKQIQERASFGKSIATKQVATVGMERFQHGNPNIPKEEAIKEFGNGNGEKEKFPRKHPLGRRLLHTSKGSSPTPPAPVAESKARGPVTPSGPSPCTHIPKGKGHCKSKGGGKQQRHRRRTRRMQLDYSGIH